MNTKVKSKIFLDVCMTILMFAVMSYQYLGENNHEIAGAILFTLFILHHLLNWNWYKMLGTGRYSPRRIFQIAVNMLLLADMLVLMISAMGLSRYVFRFLDLGISTSLSRNLHMIASHGCFLLMGLHIGMHYGMIQGMVKRLFHMAEENQLRKWTMRGCAMALAAYGFYALLKREFLSYITRKVQYAFFDYEEPVLFYELDLFAIMCLMIVIGYYLQKGLSFSGSASSKAGRRARHDEGIDD